jgi:hypothetical protein
MSDDEKFVLTPKGYFTHLLNDHGISFADSEEAWLMFEAFCLRRSRDDYPDSETAALVFDGHGGDVIGVDEA